MSDTPEPRWPEPVPVSLALRRMVRLAEEGYDMWIRDDDGRDTDDLTDEFATVLAEAREALQREESR